MKEKKWLFFRVIVYLCLAIATLMLSLIIYYLLLGYRGLGLHSIETIVSIFIISLLLQIAFNILNIRLIHHYLFNKLSPNPSFNSWHTFLLIMNSGIAVALIYLFLYEFLETFKAASYRKSANREDITALLLTGTYAFITICTITGSFILRRYIKYFTTLQEEEWLNRLGS